MLTHPVTSVEHRCHCLVNDDGAGVRDEDVHRIRYGHLGMRERVALFGGELRAGPLPGGGYEVGASLPTDEEPP